MALTIDQSVSGDVVILRAQGRITLGEESNNLREVIRDLLKSGYNKIILNLQGVSYIDSAGLGTLVSAYSSARSRGGALKLTGIRAKNLDLLQTTRLFTIFDIAENEDEALGGDWPGPRAR